jgi:hypothetical protein
MLNKYADSFDYFYGRKEGVEDMLREAVESVRELG